MTVAIDTINTDYYKSCRNSDTNTEEKSKIKELDHLKEIQNLIEEFNANSTYHYLLRLKYGVKKPWF